MWCQNCPVNVGIDIWGGSSGPSRRDPAPCSAVEWGMVRMFVAILYPVVDACLASESKMCVALLSTMAACMINGSVAMALFQYIAMLLYRQWIL